MISFKYRNYILSVMEMWAQLLVAVLFLLHVNKHYANVTTYYLAEQRIVFA